MWPALLEQLHQQKASTAAYLAEAAPIGAEKGDPVQIVIGFRKGFEFHYKALDRLATRQMIEQILGTLVGCSVRCVLQVVDELPVVEAEKSPSSQSPAKVNRPDSALLNSVIELFEGRILPGEG